MKKIEGFRIVGVIPATGFAKVFRNEVKGPTYAVPVVGWAIKQYIEEETDYDTMEITRSWCQELMPITLDGEMLSDEWFNKYDTKADDLVWATPVSHPQFLWFAEHGEHPSGTDAKTITESLIASVKEKEVYVRKLRHQDALFEKGLEKFKARVLRQAKAKGATATHTERQWKDLYKRELRNRDIVKGAK